MNGNFISLISTVINFVDEFTRAKTATRRLTEVIDATPEEEDNSKKPFVEISSNADIICTNLTFHYPGRIDLLEDFSLTIPGGKNIALIGKSGCGKSTLAKLLAGLYVPDSGNIRIGFFNIQDIALDCYRQQVVYVPQEPHFWSRTILENFRLGTPNISFEDIVQACDIADADGFISQLDPAYLNSIHKYERALRQRNNLLKDQFTKDDEIFVWNIILSEHGSYIIEKRIAFIEQINNKINDGK
jgi:ABC-type bacteriocin/lantibiotic exporter with double-glycine peptidase domain